MSFLKTLAFVLFANLHPTIDEMQINNASNQMNINKEFDEKMNTMIANFASSVDGISKYKEQVDALTRKVAELNNVYGNMLAAMQTRL